MNRTPDGNESHGTSVAELALRELQDRIEASGLESSYAELVCDLCVGQVSLERRLARFHQKAMERMVELLDTRILEDEVALEACLDKIAKESERVAWNALEQGTEALREGLAILEGAETLGDGEYVN